jgi:aldehyde:ferredoxin oxidoreductase
LSITTIANIFANDPAVESKIVSVVTGKEVDEDGLYKIGEMVFNLQRAILAREGNRGREADRVVN